MKLVESLSLMTRKSMYFSRLSSSSCVKSARLDRMNASCILFRTTISSITALRWMPSAMVCSMGERSGGGCDLVGPPKTTEHEVANEDHVLDRNESQPDAQPDERRDSGELREHQHRIRRAQG